MAAHAGRVRRSLASRLQARRGVLLLLVALVSAAACDSVSSSGNNSELSAGSETPQLSATDQRGAEVSTTGASDQYTVVYFYPKDGTPGCTKEACAFRDVWQRFQDAGVRVIGVSADDVESHRKFTEEHSLPFSLVSDTDGKWARAFGVPVTSGRFARTTFLLAPSGKLAKVYKDVDPGVHAEQILTGVKALGG